MTHRSEPAHRILAIDPGRDKCGLAVVDEAGRVLSRRITVAAEMEATVLSWTGEWQIEQIVLGDATSSHYWRKLLERRLPVIPLVVVNEIGSTLEARVLYWQANPPRGWRKLLPISLQVPPEPLDDFAAVVLARRWLAQEKIDSGASPMP